MILQAGNDKVILMRQTNSFSASTNGVGSSGLAVLSQWTGVGLSKVKAARHKKQGVVRKGRGEKCSDVT